MLQVPSTKSGCKLTIKAMQTDNMTFPTGTRSAQTWCANHLIAIGIVSATAFLRIKTEKYALE
jgi:hypothetical protein